MLNLKTLIVVSAGTSEIKEKNLRPDVSNPGNSLPKASPAVIVPPSQPSPQERRLLFTRNLSVLENIAIVNTVDDTSPPLNFQFITENLLRDGVERVPDDFMVGCSCRKDNGRQMGCEYLSCSCIEDQSNSEGKRAFPYSMAKFNTACLRDAFLKGRTAIFECNKLCNCESNCKNRVVQHGRKVGLEIFKTRNRGWGM